MSTLFNRDVLRHMLDTGAPLRLAANRAVGKTTSAVLAAIAESYKRPGQWVEVADPDQTTESTRQNLVFTIKETLRRLGLERIDVALRPYVRTGLDRNLRGSGYYAAVLNTFCESIE